MITVALRSYKCEQQSFQLLILRQTDVLRGSGGIFACAPKIGSGFWKRGDGLAGTGGSGSGLGLPPGGTGWLQAPPGSRRCFKKQNILKK